MTSHNPFNIVHFPGAEVGSTLLGQLSVIIAFFIHIFESTPNNTPNYLSLVRID